MPKVTDKEALQKTTVNWLRVDSIAALLLENDRYLESKRSHELISMIMEKFNLQERQAWEYIKEARKLVKGMGNKDLIRNFKKAVRDRENLWNKAMAANDYRLALEVAKDRDRILGLYAERIIHTGTVTNKNIDLNRFSEYGLERIARGESIEEVLLDPRALIENNSNKVKPLAR